MSFFPFRIYSPLTDFGQHSHTKTLSICFFILRGFFVFFLPGTFCYLVPTLLCPIKRLNLFTSTYGHDNWSCCVSVCVPVILAEPGSPQDRRAPVVWVT